ncbi:putative T6SS immunity periplasmic lipoprotein [Serratia plymuthica]|uniref:putative T6SS immunity periplasmic lipoprotein n=2 Tax=Serratia plymuthica TaxID=82996 RepID=UPI0018D8BE6C|nr:hypothetical protein I6G53_23650 [Serratia plymuthica]
MRKCFLLALPFFISGCPMGDRVYWEPAQATVAGNKICVFVGENDLRKYDFILKVRIWKIGNDSYVYEKLYVNNPIKIKSDKCIPDIGDFNFIPVVGYSISVSAPLNTYMTDFIFLEE